MLSGPGLGAPEWVSGEPGGGDQIDESEDEDAGNECPSAFEEIHDGIEELNECHDDHEIAEGATRAERKESNEHDGEDSVACGEVSGIDVDGAVDFIMR